jgi:rhodanese-related sulfurtransferase
MQQFLDFSLRHWELWLAFFAILIALALFELRNRLTGLRGISPQETILLINRDEGVVVDVRNSDAFIKGHIVGAINIAADDLTNQLSRLEKQQDKIIILVSQPPQAPGKAATLLQRNGFTNVQYLAGGITAWQSAGLPLVKGK